MRIEISEGLKLICDAMAANGYTVQEAEVIADHLMDCELRGLGYAGIARALTIAEYIREGGLEHRQIEIISETPASIHLNGNNSVGYLVARQATEAAIKKAKAMGLAVAGASKTYYTGMFSYYLEMVTNAGLVGLIAGSGPSLVAPFGGTQPRLCTNPIAFGFPTENVPVIWDIGTGIITHAEVVLSKRRGQPLPEGIAFDEAGKPTRSAASILEGGAITNWGGAKGFGLSLSIQMLSMMVGQINDHSGQRYPMDCGFFICVFDPGLFGAKEDYISSLTDYAAMVAKTEPLNPKKPVRLPFARSFEERRKRNSDGWIEVNEEIVTSLKSLV